MPAGGDTTLALTLTNDGPGESSLEYSFPGFASQSLLARPGVERNRTSSVVADASHEKGQDRYDGMGHPVRTGAGGPDAFGYRWIDSNEPGGPSFRFEDVSQEGTALGLTDDFEGTSAVSVALPFAFDYYGQLRDSLTISNNGVAFFEGDPEGYISNDQIPSADIPNGVIAPFWDDLDPGETDSAEVYAHYDEAGDRFIVQWDQVPAFFGEVPMTFQLVLGADGAIRFNVLDVDEEDNDSATMGIEDLSGERGLQVAFNTPYPEDSLSVVMTRTPDYIADVSPASGTLGGGESEDVTVTVDAADLGPGTYGGDLLLMSNDTTNSRASIPSGLTVIETPPALALAPDTLAFGDVLVGGSATRTFSIENTGGSPLTVESVNFSGAYAPVDSGDTGPFTVEIEESRAVEVRFSPGAAGTFPDSILVQSDATNQPTATVRVEGDGVPAPALAYSPDSLSADLESGEDTTLALTLSNDGASGSTLDFSFPGFASQSLLARPGVERNRTTSVIEDPGHEAGNDPHAGIGHPVRTGAGGPDDFGYRWIDSNEPGGPSFQFEDVRDVGTPLGLGFADYVRVALPFSFEFYGAPQDTLTISNNGLVYFEDVYGPYFANQEMPNADAPNGIVAPFWDNLAPEASDSAEVYTYHDETDDRFIVQWDQVPAFGDEVPVTFQLVLGAGGSIRFNLLDVAEDNNDSATMGIEDLSGERGLQVAFNTPYPEDSLSVAIVRTPKYIADVSPASGTIDGGASENVDVTVDGDGIGAGTYEQDLALSSSDPDASSAEIPTTLTVNGGSGACPLAWSLDLVVSDSTGEGETLTLGQGPSATAGLDADCGEAEQPPVPPAPVTDVRFVDANLSGVSLGEGTLVDVRPDDTPTPNVASGRWRVSVQTDDDPVSLAWDEDGLSDALPQQTVRLVDAVTQGDLLSVNMKTVGAYTLTNDDVSALEVQVGDGTSMAMHLHNGWNLKSMPLQLDNMSFGHMSGLCPSGFAYLPQSGYDPLGEDETMNMGTGYWLNCTAATLQMSGVVPPTPHAEVEAGWNVVGPYATPVPVSAVTSEPGGIVQAGPYGFEPETGYQVADTLKPAQGYWVKASEAGVLHFSDSTTSGTAVTATTRAAHMSDEDRSPLRLSLTDAEGRTATLRFVSQGSGRAQNRQPLPPVPPSSVFDVRFEGGHRTVQVGTEARHAIETQGLSAPVTVRMQGAAPEQGLHLRYGSGADVQTRRLSAETPSAQLSSVKSLTVGVQEVPDAFALRKSVPNPIRHRAIVEYAVPEATTVTIEVYDVLGRRVARLVDGRKNAGTYEVRLDAAQLSSGTYFYRMQAGDFQKTRRLTVVR